MITISPVYNQFEVKYSNPGSGLRGFKTMAHNWSEVHTAIDHISGPQGHMGTHPECPFCRQGRGTQKAVVPIKSRKARKSRKTKSPFYPISFEMRNHTNGVRLSRHAVRSVAEEMRVLQRVRAKHPFAVQRNREDIRGGMFFIVGPTAANPEDTVFQLCKVRLAHLGCSVHEAYDNDWYDVQETATSLSEIQKLARKKWRQKRPLTVL